MRTDLGRMNFGKIFGPKLHTGRSLRDIRVNHLEQGWANIFGYGQNLIKTFTRRPLQHWLDLEWWSKSFKQCVQEHLNFKG